MSKRKNQNVGLLLLNLFCLLLLTVTFLTLSFLLAIHGDNLTLRGTYASVLVFGDMLLLLFAMRVFVLRILRRQE